MHESTLQALSANLPTARCLALCAALLLGLGADAASTSGQDAAAVAVDSHVPVPLFVSGTDPDRHGFVRVINRSNRDGTVSIHAIDEAGRRFGPVDLALRAGAARQFSSADLEWGNAAKGLPGIGAGHGDWRLELATDLDIGALSYVRAADGSVTRVDGTVAIAQGSLCEIGFFNPASNTRQVSMLRLANAGAQDAEVAVSGVDDRGRAAPDGEVYLTVPAGQSRSVGANELERGGASLRGRLGDGAGKWRLSVSADEPVEVTNLLSSPGGALVVASTCEEPQQAGNVVIDRAQSVGTGQWGSDAYELVDAAIEGDALIATVSYGGGCRDHEFTLVLADTFMMMDPVRLQATLAHEANEDPCEAWLTEKLTFDLAAVKALHGGSGTVVLLLSVADGSEIELTYVF